MASELWERIRALRKHFGLSGEAFGAEFDVSKAAVSQWEARDATKRTKPDLQKVIDMASRFGVPLDWLLDDRADLSFEWWMSRPASSHQSHAAPSPIEIVDALAAVKSDRRDELSRVLALMLQNDSPLYRQRVAQLLAPDQAAAPTSTLDDEVAPPPDSNATNVITMGDQDDRGGQRRSEKQKRGTVPPKHHRKESE